MEKVHAFLFNMITQEIVVIVFGMKSVITPITGSAKFLIAALYVNDDDFRKVVFLSIRKTTVSPSGSGQRQ